MVEQKYYVEVKRWKDSVPLNSIYRYFPTKSSALKFVSDNVGVDKEVKIGQYYKQVK